MQMTNVSPTLFSFLRFSQGSPFAWLVNFILNIFSMKLCVLPHLPRSRPMLFSSLPLPSPQDLPFPKCSKECQDLGFLVDKIQRNSRQNGISETANNMIYIYAKNYMSILFAKCSNLTWSYLSLHQMLISSDFIQNLTTSHI